MHQQRIQFGVGFDILAKRYNHTDPRTTMLYLGIEDKEVHHVLMNEISLPILMRLFEGIINGINRYYY